MFALIESQRTAVAVDVWPARVTSFAAHALLVAGAVWATQHAPPVAVPPLVATPVVWPLRPEPPAPRLPAPPVEPLPDAPVVAAPAPVPVASAPIVAVPDPGVPPAAATDPAVSQAPGPPVPVAASPTGLPGGTGEPQDARYVEEPPVLLAHPPLRYPELLQRAGIRGSALIEAVIDTAGRVEPRSTRVLQADHRLFGEAASALVAASRYRAARVSGRAVRVRVQVPVAFALRP